MTGFRWLTAGESHGKGLTAIVEGVPAGLTMSEDLIAGDSGNPSFLWIRGEPVLLETHTTGGSGAGPFYGSPINHAAINNAIASLAELYDGPLYEFRTVEP